LKVVPALVRWLSQSCYFSKEYYLLPVKCTILFCIELMLIEKWWEIGRMGRFILSRLLLLTRSESTAGHRESLIGW
jgi:hypothetical protein